MPSSINNLTSAVEKATHTEAALAKQVGNQAEFNCPSLSQTTTQWMTTQFEINDLNAASLMFLTNKSIQNEIEQSSGTIVATRGQYMASKEKNQASSEQPLHLFIQGPKKQNLEFAIKEIQSYIEKAKCISICPNLRSSPLINGAKVEKVLIGLDAPPSFDLKKKILGLNGVNLQNIMNKTGATVTMRGQGSGFIEVNGQESVEPLHLHIEHDENEVLQKSKYLAFNLIKNVKEKLNSSYAASHLASQFNVVYQPSNISLQQPLEIYPKYVQTNKRQKLQINPTHYQIVQVAAQSLEDRSQTMQKNVTGDQIPLSSLNSVSQIVAVFPTITRNRLQIEQFQGLSHIASTDQHQATIKPQLLTQVANQNQQQLPFCITLENLENDQHASSVAYTGPTSLANDVMPHSVASLPQSTVPIQYIQIPNDQIITYQPSMQSINFETALTPHSCQSNQPSNFGSIGTSYIPNNQMVQYQQTSGHPSQVMIMQCQQSPTTETKKSAVQPIYLHQIQSVLLVPVNTPNDLLTVQQMVDQPTQLQVIIPQLNQFQNLQPQIIHNYSDVIQLQVISPISTQQLQLECEDKQFTQHINAVSNNQLVLLPIPHHILPQENGIVTIILPQQQQLRLQNQQIQTQITDKQFICKEEDDQSVMEMIPQGQQQSVQYFQQQQLRLQNQQIQTQITDKQFICKEEDDQSVMEMIPQGQQQSVQYFQQQQLRLQNQQIQTQITDKQFICKEEDDQSVMEMIPQGQQQSVQYFQQQQLRLQNQQIQTQITDKQFICKEEDDQSVMEMIPQGQQQSVQYFQQQQLRLQNHQIQTQITDKQFICKEEDDQSVMEMIPQGQQQSVQYFQQQQLRLQNQQIQTQITDKQFICKEEDDQSVMEMIPQGQQQSVQYFQQQQLRLQNQQIQTQITDKQFICKEEDDQSVMEMIPQGQQQSVQYFQQQQLRLQNHQIQTQLTDKQFICKEEDDQSVMEMIPQGQQQSVQYFQLNDQFQNQPFDQSHVIVPDIGDLSGAKLKQAGSSQIISNDGSDNNPAWQLIVNDLVGTMSTGKHNAN